MLRDYQQDVINQTWDYMRSNPGNPCLEMPTGSGKSWVVAGLCKDAMQYGGTRILMLTHVRELISQNYEKIKTLWPEAPVGIYAAGLKRKETHQPIIYGSVQTVQRNIEAMGEIDLIMVDECFTGDTLVSTPFGEKRIDQVRRGDLVYNQCGVGFVKSVFRQIKGKIYEVKLSNGEKIKCTGDHPFFTENGWQQARALENGARLYTRKDMQAMWRDVQTLGETRQERECNISAPRAKMEKERILLNTVLKESESYRFDKDSKRKDKKNTEKNRAQTYKKMRKRALATFATASAIARAWSWMGSRIRNKNRRGAQKWSLSKLLQGGHSAFREKGRDRNRWIQPLNRKKKGARHEETKNAKQIRVESVKAIQQTGDELVYNLRVSGHPSYFAGGVAVHNCHRINHKNEGGYRGIIEQLNPHRVIGLTASPYRLGHGYITDGDALFSDIIKPVSTEELTGRGYLAPLRNKRTEHRISTEGVKKRGGEYIESELQAAVNTDHNNESAVKETIKRASDRKAWLFFCTGIDHSYAIRDILRREGITAETICGHTPTDERDAIIRRFKSGEVRAVTNANVLTTGFDYPDIDCLVFLRPTESAALYCQMAGRGMRPKSHCDDCLVLDFAQLVWTHGPVTNIKPKKKGEKGEAPIKSCENCGEIVPLGTRECPACGAAFENNAPEKKYEINDKIDIMGKQEIYKMEVDNWRSSVYTTKSGKDAIKVDYMSGFSRVSEYLCVLHDGYAGRKATQELIKIAGKAGITLTDENDIHAVANKLNEGKPPNSISYVMNGKYENIIKRDWDNDDQLRNTG